MSKWEIFKIGDVCKTSSGGTPLKLNNDYYDNGDIPWLVSGEVCQKNILNNKNYITQKGLENSSAKLFPVNTVLVAMYGATAGQVGILRFESATNQAICGILPNKRIIPEFLYYALLFKKSELIAQATGNAQPNISQIKIKNTKIPVPPIEEQKRIVEILDKAFEGIAQAEANTRRNLINARELFDSYLNNIFRERGDEWTDKNLKDIAIEFGRGKSKHRPRNDKKLYGGNYPFVQTGDIRNSDHIVTNYSQTYNDTGLAQSKLWKKGTVCITIAANIAETAVLDFDACIPDSVIGLLVDDQKANNMFVEYMLQSFKLMLQSKGKGSAQDNINMGTFKDLVFPFPPDLEIQQDIVEKLDFLSSAKQKLETIYQRKLEAIAELKQSILEKAFTGQLSQ
jgi:type I restriction enzyme S subunit